MKASKKPEEAVPILDMIENSTYFTAEGQEVQGWVMLKNTQFRHVNVCMNDIGEDLRDSVAALLRRTNDDFGLTLSGNPISKDIVEGLQRIATEVHHHRAATNEGQSVDPNIAHKRVAF